jgi:Helix-turn-helix domain
MEANNQHDEKQPAKRSAFTLMNNIRDYCEQSDPKKLLLFTLATYCNGDGICYPSNKRLSDVTRKSRRTVQRMLKELVADGELEILSHGGGQTKRVLCLRRYPEGGDAQMSRGGDAQMSRGVVTGSLGKTCQNNHREQPVTAKGKGRMSPQSSDTDCFFPKVDYPDSEEEMAEMLERLGIQHEPDYDGNFFAQMEMSDWKIKGKRVRDWPKAYKARLKVTFPGNGY